MGGAEVEDVLQAWMETYLAREHPDMPRPGTVCPFVKPALDARSIEIRSVSTPGTAPQGTALAVTRAAVGEFAEERVPGARGVLSSLVLAFPDLVDRGRLVDQIHELVKHEAVNAGLMIGQFHAECEEPSARNPQFAVNRSPIPLLVIREMTVHDILFLHGNPIWFRIYDERFGRLYGDGHRIDPAFAELYGTARKRYSDLGPAVSCPYAAGHVSASAR